MGLGKDEAGFNSRVSERYEILNLIGRTELTEVYRVRDRTNQRILALKILLKNSSADDGLLLSREFFYLSQLSHPNIVKVFDYGLSRDGRPFFTMEFVPGVELRRFFAGWSPKLVNALVEVLWALDAIHREGLVHCDVKPSNILVYEDEDKVRVKLLDLGFAEGLPGVELGGNNLGLQFNRRRGTLGYVAPEVLKGWEADGRSDLYSLGLVLYEVLTGRGPGDGMQLEEWLKRQYVSGFEPVRRFNPEVPEALESIVMRMISQERERRPRSARALIAELVLAELMPLDKFRGGGSPVMAETIDPQAETAMAAVGGAEAAVSARKDLLAPGFVGRKEIVDELKRMVADAARGIPGVALISGERGAGKSRCLAEVKFFAQLEGATVLAFEPVALGARSQSLVELLIGVLKAGTDVEEALDLGAFEQSKFRLFEQLVRRLKGLAESHRLTHSLVLLVDDFELFDPLSLEFVRYLALGLKKERILLLISGLNEKRFTDLIAVLTERPHCRHFEVGVLNRDEVRQMVVSMVGEVNGLDDLVTWIYDFGGGNPLTTIEMVYALVEQGVLRRQGLDWQFARDELSVLAIPRSVRDVVRRRLEDLLPDELSVLEVGALVAGPFTVEFLRAVLNLQDRPLFQAVSRLKAGGFLKPFYQRNNETGQVKPALVLASKILETTVTERIPPERRREIHRRIALAMELSFGGEQERLVFELAHQWIQSGDRERAYRYSVQAGERAREWLLFNEARQFYESALALAPDYVPVSERLGLIERVGELREATGGLREAIDIYRQGMSLVVAQPAPGGERVLLARFLRRLGLVQQKLGNTGEALAAFNQALALGQDRETIECARLLADLGWCHCSCGNLNQAEEYLTRAIRKAERLRGEFPREANRLVGLVLYYFAVLAQARADFVLARQLAEKSLDVFRAIDEQVMISLLNQFLATLWLRRGEVDKARRCYEDAVRTQRRAGDVYYLLSSYHGLGLISYEQGEWQEAERLFSEALGLAEQIGSEIDAFNLNSLLGNISFDRGEWNRAKECFEQAGKITEYAGRRISAASRARLGLMRAELYSVMGDLTIAEHCLREVQETVASHQDPEVEFFIPLIQAKMELRAERFERVKGYLIQAISAVRNCQNPGLRGRVWLTAGNYRLATRTRANFEAERALAVFKEKPGTIEYAQALRLMAQCRCAAGKKEPAVALFQESVEILRRLGAKYELGLSLLATADLFGGEGLPLPQDFQTIPGERYEWVRANLQEAVSIFKLLGNDLEAERSERTLDRLEQVFGIIRLKARERNEYLKVFYQLSELVNTGIDRDDFLEQVLGLVLSVTRAERGIIFLFQRDRLVPVAARDVEHSTVVDAEAISHSVLRRARRRREPLVSADALFDPRFNSAHSVVLNKIRSLLCVPLVIEDRVIGTIYLDSRVTTHLFTEEDRNLLQSVGHLLAATIEKCRVYQQWRQEFRSEGEDLAVDPQTGLFLGRSRAMRDVLRFINKIAPTDCTVLLTGETGAGKGVIARLIHQRSGRKDNKFVAVNCGTLPETLFESELFGHLRGAFTGAVRDKAGLFEIANGGTIFLDEITNTTLAIQAKLLQVLEEKIIRRLGDTESRLVDVRLICATNKDLMAEVKAGRFREDLFYRVNVVSIRVPPLRERVQDIIPLANYFLRNYAQQLNKEVQGFESDVNEILTQYHWPGNVRELQNTIERAVIVTQNPKITIQDLGEPFIQLKQTLNEQPNQRRRLTREQIVQALEQTRGNISQAANLLATHRRQVQRLIKRYKINPMKPDNTGI
ncbi:MAG: sigma 54-interacting transcriptional regulator [bacterium]